ncbi:hypothetical protein WPS_34750 [Vulcanimicrobium alpinum]|uniref:Carbohydrate kinase PfkB domain-containing protein n=1 Tax=Vulcanimicrobium alpinum TaxID=3016050 RepID=A0AAN1Y051_UNVUL|nr:D-glycero-beta-D-manno-heptose-7-phosphate kinase [Vulcanimicrobium alpinum]BDE08199.1 hypothetical protein WPS_34750 [Vulcanimicrobium alpinum]
MTRARPAAFLDRDGTLIDDKGFLGDPAGVELLPTVVDALRLWRAERYAIVVVSNQSGIARGFLDEAQVRAVNGEIARQLAAHGVTVDGWYWCSHYGVGCDCRKPEPGLVHRAARELELDLASGRGGVVGDRGNDVELGHRVGIAGVLVPGPYEYVGPEPDFRAATLLEAATYILARDASRHAERVDVSLHAERGEAPPASRTQEGAMGLPFETGVGEVIAVPRATALLGRMAGRKIVVVGDVMIDEWIWGDVSRISPEAPVPVVAVREHTFTLGGAGNVANNLRALGAHVAFVGGVGDDAEGARLREMLAAIDVDAGGVLTLGDRPTTRKTRVVAHNQQVVRADWESTAPFGDADRARFADAVRRAARDADAVVLSDYAKGMLHRDLVEAALAAPVVVADPKPQNVAIFAGVTCIGPNVGEAARASGVAITDDASLERAARTLLRMLDCRWVLITRGEHGMSLFGAQSERFDIPAVARTVYDVSGAGDTVVAVLTLALAAGIPADVATQLANFAAGAVVEKLGTATATPAEIVALMDETVER